MKKNRKRTAGFVSGQFFILATEVSQHKFNITDPLSNHNKQSSCFIIGRMD